MPAKSPGAWRVIRRASDPAVHVSPARLHPEARQNAQLAAQAQGPPVRSGSIPARRQTRVRNGMPIAVQPRVRCPAVQCWPRLRAEPPTRFSAGWVLVRTVGAACWQLRGGARVPRQTPVAAPGSIVLTQSDAGCAQRRDAVTGSTSFRHALLPGSQAPCSPWLGPKPSSGISGRRGCGKAGRRGASRRRPAATNVRESACAAAGCG